MTDMEPVHGIDRAAVMQYLGLKNDIATQALLAICNKYGLDPLMKHVVLIGSKPYITRDGYLHVAHATGQLDGIEVLEEGETDTEWWAKVAVHRRDMSKPFTYRGRYPHSGMQKQYGPEMAVKTAEVMALRRAFDVSGIPAADEQWDDTIDVRATPAVDLPKFVPMELQDIIDDIDGIPDAERRLALSESIFVRIWSTHVHPDGTSIMLEDIPDNWVPIVRKMVDKALTPQGLEAAASSGGVAGTTSATTDAATPSEFDDEGLPAAVADKAAELLGDRFPGAVDDETGELLPTGGSPATARRVMEEAKARKPALGGVKK